MNLQSDIIVNPLTGKSIGKYDAVWWQIIRKSKNKAETEEYLENQPLVSVQTPILTRVKHLDLNNIKPTRAGVILYTIINNQLILGLGLDAQFKQLTDFSGGINKKDINVLTAALREFNEESLNLFGRIDTYDILDAPVLYDKHTLIIFYYVDEHPDDITIAFRKLKNNYKGNVEIDDIVWVTPEELLISIQLKLKHIYVRLLNFLAKAGDFYDDLYYNNF